MRPVVLAVLLAVGAAIAGGCATVPPGPPPSAAPAYPDFARPVIPPGLLVTARLSDRHDRAWQQLQAGDPAGAAREFEAILAADGTFYPAAVGLGYTRLAADDYDEAATWFGRAVEANDAYLPAWQGLMDAHLGQGNDAESIVAIERVLTLDPGRTDLARRLELLRFRRVQALIAEGRQARDERRLTAALEAFEQALELSPTSGALHRELALVEIETGALEAAEAHARRALELDANDAESHAALGAILERQGRDREAAEAFEAAVRLDPRPEWRERAERLGTRADLVVIPAEFRAVPTAATVTRAQVAAFIGIRLETLLSRAPDRVTGVATDIRGHWAEPWILPVTRAGVIELFPNHTFQPATTVRRGDLARMIAVLLELNPQRRMDLMRWQSLQPTFADLPSGNLFYPAAALAVSAGAMSADARGRFRATDPASGPELVEAIARVEQISGR